MSKDRISETVAAAAARWRAKLDGDDASEADWLAYEQWLAEDEAHRAAANAIDDALIMAESSRSESNAPAAGSNVTPFIRRWAARPVVWAGAATALAASLVLFVMASPPPAQEFVYSAPTDASRAVTLPDGSTIQLNRGAALHVSYGRERRADLTRGEASFSVRHDPTHPFQVAAGDILVRDIGTEFNVARNAASIVVTVRSGEVALIAPNAASTLVHAGQQARAAAGTVSVRSSEADDAFAWQSGRLVYHDAPLAAVIEDFNRYSATPIVLETPAANALHFSGVLVIDEPRVMLARLQGFLPIRVHEEASRIVVRSTS
ncbi:MAG TPA: FecR domain-containing protein [Caulobacterales bacterium]|nr:FecR domain-containing protein [Caulobacterales bacterium]